MLIQKLDFYEQQIEDLSKKEEYHINEIDNAKITHNDKMKVFQKVLETDVEKTKQRLQIINIEKEKVEEKLRDTENKLLTETNNHQTTEKNYV